MEKDSVDCKVKGVVLNKDKSVRFFVRNGSLYDSHHMFSLDQGLVKGGFVNGNTAYLPIDHGCCKSVGEIVYKDKVHN